MGGGPGGAGFSATALRSFVRDAIQQELSELQGVAHRLETWLQTRAPDEPGILYLCNDGFDRDIAEVYFQALAGDPQVSGEIQALRMEFASAVPKLFDSLGPELAARGMRVIIVALGGVASEFATGAANSELRPGKDIYQVLDSVPVPYFLHPLEELAQVAAVTGGGVVTSDAGLEKSLEDLANSYIVSVRCPANAPHGNRGLHISSRRAGLRLVASQYLFEPGPARSRHAPPITGGLPHGDSRLKVEAALAPTESRGERREGELTVTVDLAEILPILERLGAGRMSITVEVQLDGYQPYVRREDTDLSRSGNGTFWIYTTRLVWPSEATGNVFISAYELTTGTSGGALVVIHRSD